MALETEMNEAAAAFDFERAAALRDAIARLRARRATPRHSRRGGQCRVLTVGSGPPGQIGLGSNAPVRKPPRGWDEAKKPDPMTRATRDGVGRGSAGLLQSFGDERLDLPQLCIVVSRSARCRSSRAIRSSTLPTSRCTCWLRSAS